MIRVLPTEAVEAIERLIPQSATPERPSNLGFNYATEAAGVLALVDAVPAELLILDSSEMAAWVVARAAIQNFIAECRSRGNGAGALHTGHAVVLRQLLQKCPDQIVPSSTAQLLFVVDVDLRESLRLDIAEADRSLLGGQWKAAAILSSSVIEALLLWVVSTQFSASERTTAIAALSGKVLQQAPPTDLDEWGPHPLIEVSAHLKAISGDAAILCRRTKNYRALIHPGRERRDGKRVDRGAARVALGTLDRVLAELSANYSSTS